MGFRMVEEEVVVVLCMLQGFPELLVPIVLVLPAGGDQVVLGILVLHLVVMPMAGGREDLELVIVEVVEEMVVVDVVAGLAALQIQLGSYHQPPTPQPS